MARSRALTSSPWALTAAPCNWRQSNRADRARAVSDSLHLRPRAPATPSPASPGRTKGTTMGGPRYIGPGYRLYPAFPSSDGQIIPWAEEPAESPELTSSHVGWGHTSVGT